MNLYIKKQSFLQNKIFLRFVFLLSLIILLNIFQSPIRESFNFLHTPISTMLLQAGEGTFHFFGSFINVSRLYKENNSLKEENQNLLSQVVLLQDSLKIDQATKEALQNVKDSNLKIVPVQIIGLNIHEDIITIDRGLDDGLSENMPVISSNKILYGRVVKVYRNFSEVMLISAASSTLAVKINPEDPLLQPVHGALEGIGSLSLYLDLVNTESQIKEQDVVVSSSLEGIFPKDLLIGKISSVIKNDVKPFQTANIQPFFDVKKIENLFVITNYKNEPN